MLINNINVLSSLKYFLFLTQPFLDTMTTHMLLPVRRTSAVSALSFLFLQNVYCMYRAYANQDTLSVAQCHTDFNQKLCLH